MSPCERKQTTFGGQLLSYFQLFSWLVSFTSISNWFPNSKTLTCKKPVQERCREWSIDVCHDKKVKTSEKKSNNSHTKETLYAFVSHQDNVSSQLEFVNDIKNHISVSEEINNTAECKLGLTAVKEGEIININKGHKHSKDAVENTISNSDELAFGISSFLWAVLITLAVENTITIPEYDELGLNTSSGIQSDDMMKEPKLLGLNGQDKNGSDTNVHGQGGSEQSSSSQQNPTGTPAYCPSDRNHCGMGYGGSDGDGNEPSDTSISVPNGHYQETPVPVQPEQDKNAAGLKKLNSDGNCQDLPTFGNNDMSVDVSSDTFAQDGNTSNERLDSDVTRHANSLNSHPTSLPVLAPNFSPNPHLSDQACYVSKSNGVHPSKTQPQKTKSKQAILYPFHKQVLSVGKDGRYEQNRDFEIFDNVPVGRGAFGVCVLCRDRKTGINFVRKEVKKREFYMNEIIIWKKLTNYSGMNLNIIRLWGAYEGEEHMSMFMEPMSGTLTDIVGKHENFLLSEEEIYSIVKQVLHGLDYIHGHNIVHGDIKCANLFYNVNTLQITIGDFGLSLILDELLVRPCKLRGTVNFMAPEVCRSDPYGRSADIWSLACVVYHLLTGCMPWSEYKTEEQQIIYKVGHGSSPEIPPCCSDDMKDILNSMFRLDKTKRPTAKDLLRHPTFASIPDDDEVLHNWFYRIFEHEHNQLQPSLTSEETPSALSVDHQIMDDSCSPMSLSGQKDLIHSDDPQSETISDGAMMQGQIEV